MHTWISRNLFLAFLEGFCAGQDMLSMGPQSVAGKVWFFEEKAKKIARRRIHADQICQVTLSGCHSTASFL